MEKMRTLYFTEYVRNGSAREIDEACGSDYSGGIVQKSNFETMCKMINEKFPNTEAFIELEGMYYTYGIGVFEDKLTDEEIEWLEEVESALENYPVYDEDHLSELEYEAIHDFYSQEVRSELFGYARKRGLIPDDKVEIDVKNTEELFAKISSGGYAITETGGLVYIDWQGALNSIPDEEIVKYIVMEPVEEEVTNDCN